MAITPFDTACVIIILLVAIRASLRGLVAEVAGTASLVLGVLLSALFFDEGAAFIRERGFVTMAVVPEMIAFAAIFIAVFIAVKLVEGILKDIIQRISLSAIDHLLGFFFGIAEALVVIVAIMAIINVQPLFDKSIVLDGSVFARFLMPNAEALRRGVLGLNV
ncbi:MAG: CvpA family protein [Spirochaetaceae bacterium]|jgi:membrane protein required for colicin V production|nr:CvpA family protein [Spirochaetaceae bacterium]